MNLVLDNVVRASWLANDIRHPPQRLDDHRVSVIMPHRVLPVNVHDLPDPTHLIVRLVKDEVGDMIVCPLECEAVLDLLRKIIRVILSRAGRAVVRRSNVLEWVLRRNRGERPVDVGIL